MADPPTNSEPAHRRRRRRSEVLTQARAKLWRAFVGCSHHLTAEERLDLTYWLRQFARARIRSDADRYAEKAQAAIQRLQLGPIVQVQPQRGSPISEQLPP